MSDFFTSKFTGTVTEHRNELKVLGKTESVGFTLHYEIDCSCGRFHRAGVDKEELYRKLDKHMGSHQ